MSNKFSYIVISGMLVFFSVNSFSTERLQFNTDIPKDTISVFINNYGKDSLVRLIDSTVQSANRWLHLNSEDVLTSTDINCMMAVSKQFNLGLDTLVYTNYNVDAKVFQLYRFKVGSTDVILKNIDSIAKRSLSKNDLNKLLFEYIGYETSRNSIVVYAGAYFEIPISYFDSLFSTSLRSTNLNYLLNLYWFYTQFAINYPENTKVPLEYSEIIFNKLYHNINCKSVVTNNSKNSNLYNYYKDVYMYDVFKVLAFGLYGKNNSLANNQSDLIYLLSLKNNNEGWSSTLSGELNSDPLTTFYAVWALCEYKNQLLELD